MVEGADPRRAWVLEAVSNVIDNGYSFNGRPVAEVAAEMHDYTDSPYSVQELTEELTQLNRDLIACQ